MAKSKRTEVVLNLDPYSGDIATLEDPVDPEGRGYTSPKSPNNLRYARSHAELEGRKSPPLSEGCSFREGLETEDYWNWD